MRVEDYFIPEHELTWKVRGPIPDDTSVVIKGAQKFPRNPLSLGNAEIGTLVLPSTPDIMVSNGIATVTFDLHLFGQMGVKDLMTLLMGDDVVR
jgi:hypothetical protein